MLKTMHVNSSAILCGLSYKIPTKWIEVCDYNVKNNEKVEDLNL